MIDAITFVVPGKPQPKQRARRGAGGRWYTPAATRAFETSVGHYGLLAILGQRWSSKLRYRLEVTCYMPDARRRDADNVAKSVADGLNGIAWQDDAQVVELVVRKDIDRDEPRTVVTVTSLDEASDE